MQVSAISSGATESAAAASKIKSAVYYDPKDTNQDGVVSFAEELAYSLKQLETNTPSMAGHSSLSQYGQGGTVTATELTTTNELNTYS